MLRSSGPAKLERLVGPKPHPPFARLALKPVRYLSQFGDRYNRSDSNLVYRVVCARSDGRYLGSISTNVETMKHITLTERGWERLPDGRGYDWYMRPYSAKRAELKRTGGPWSERYEERERSQTVELPVWLQCPSCGLRQCVDAEQVRAQWRRAVAAQR